MEEDEEQRVSKKATRDSPMPSDEKSRLANGPVVSKYFTSDLDKIMEDLTQPNTIIFGVIIDEGGKSEVAQIINERVERDRVFDAVVMASVTENPDLQRIQEELGNKLDLQLNEITTLNIRATLLCDKIKTKDKILIILDDLHDEIDLAKIGIPFGDDHKGCKVLLLAQTPELLCYKMKSQQLYLIDSEAVYEPERKLFLPQLLPLFVEWLPRSDKSAAGTSSDDTSLANNSEDDFFCRVYDPQRTPYIGVGAASSNCRPNSESMNSNLKEIIKDLTTQPHMSILGLYGSSDATKREMLEQITRRVERDGGVVVNVKANAVKKNTWLFWPNKSLDVNIIQGELANELGLQLHDKTSSEERATRLCDTIKTKEKILIILYDLQGRIDLDKIGIPFGNNHKGCKIMLVAETEEVLSNQINAPQIKFSVDD